MTAPLPAPLPVTVIAGYLGAGKTSLVNHLLRHAGGRRLMVLVNDFGAVNIDADLLESADEDTLTLSNGCVCCSLGGALYDALDMALERVPRPDMLVIEASGVSQPRAIAQAALAEPDMRYAGIVTLADAVNLPGLIADAQVGAQIAAQLAAADLVVLTKTDLADPAPARAAIRGLTGAPVVLGLRGAVAADLLLGLDAPAPDAAPAAHDHHHGTDFASWSYRGNAAPDRKALDRLLADPPPGVYRMKGRLRLDDGSGAEFHLVGRTFEILPCPAPPLSTAVAIGPVPGFAAERVEAAWRDCLGGSPHSDPAI